MPTNFHDEIKLNSLKISVCCQATSLREASTQNRKTQTTVTLLKGNRLCDQKILHI